MVYHKKRLASSGDLKTPLLINIFAIIGPGEREAVTEEQSGAAMVTTNYFFRKGLHSAVL